MAGLVPAIYVLPRRVSKDVDGRDECGLDGVKRRRHFTIALMRSTEVPYFSTSQIRSPTEIRSSLHQ